MDKAFLKAVYGMEKADCKVCRHREKAGDERPCDACWVTDANCWWVCLQSCKYKDTDLNKNEICNTCWAIAICYPEPDAM